ncbi:MAG: HD domain-containing protein [Anaerolineae bacterium]|nr:HD domain-containing protein [Anaerolineae bacterium]
MSALILEQLPSLASHLIDGNWHDIDDPLEHDPDWHQWGVLEHTRRVLIAMKTEVPIFCLAWGVPFIQELKNEFVQHKSKWELLLVACVVHDLGKWAGRKVNHSGSRSFKGHEAISEQLLRHDPLVLRSLLAAQLSPDQIDYIASITGLHYELGKLRQIGYQQGNFDLAFVKSDQFRLECTVLARRHQDYTREIGLIFLADSLAKVEFRPGLETFAEIEARFLEQGLPPKLMRAVHQVPVNIAMCRQYVFSLKYS